MSHARQRSGSVNRRAQLSTAYQELGKELSSEKIRVVGNYTLGKVIGEGTYGKVRLGTHRLTSTRVAIKQIPKALSPQLTREIHHHRQLHHPNVAQLYEVIATENYIWLVTELCTGGELFDYLVEKGRLSESEARVVFGQLCLAVAYVHGQGVVHRDLKLENVLLDERCQVKLGDFGFTREYEPGRLLDTFCGTTGYASPEMLLGQKYSGREVDIWSLGVILYSLLCGGLPFDDDDDFAMRNKIVHSDYAEPEWLSSSARDLIRNILQKEPEKRYTVRQILGHHWFTNPSGDDSNRPRTAMSDFDAPFGPTPEVEESPLQPHDTERSVTSPDPSSHKSETSAPSSLSEHSYHSGTSDSEPTTPDVTDNGDRLDPDKDPFGRSSAGRGGPLHRTRSQATITNNSMSQEHTPRPSIVQQKKTGIDGGTACSPVPEEEPPVPTPSSATFPSRTPVRTKRRSVSSAFSPPPSPTIPSGFVAEVDLLSLLDYPYPVVFTSPLERALLNSLSQLGFDTGQMVHSVLTHACDSSAAIWWMLRRRAERREESRRVEDIAQESDGPQQSTADRSMGMGLQFEEESEDAHDEKTPVRAELAPPLPRPVFETITSSVSAPELTARPTPPQTPPDVPKPTSTSARNSPAPSDSPDKRGKKVDPNRGRSGSITMLQRASTVLGAAGLGKKRSGEILQEELAKEARKGPESYKSRGSTDDTSGQAPAQLSEIAPGRAVPELAWAFPHKNPDIVVSPTPAPSPSEDTLSPLPTLDANGRRGFMSTLKMWWQDDRRKRKVPPGGPSFGGPRHVVKRKTGHQPSKLGTATPRHPSNISRRSSSVNSRRSSMASIHKDFVVPSLGVGLEIPSGISRQRSDPSRRSFTPTSDRGEFTASRPPSVRSASFGPQTPHVRRPQHGRQSSASSLGSAARLRTQPSPLQQYHRRAGSGSSIKVVRQIQPVHSHQRSDSAASSLHSVRSPSRPSSFYAATSPFSEDPGQLSDVEELNASPVEVALASVTESTPTEDRKQTYTTVLVAHKARPTHGPPSASPYVLPKRNSWRKSWGPEPPGWSTRSIQAPSAALEQSSATSSIRDVFAGKYGGTSSEDDEWIDEDDDIHYAGGLGQSVAASASLRADDADVFPDSPLPFRKQLYPETHYATPRKAAVGGKPRTTRNNVHSRAGTTTLAQNDTSNTKGDVLIGAAPPRARRQLPTTRGGPALRAHPIQEEDEGE